MDNIKIRELFGNEKLADVKIVITKINIIFDDPKQIENKIERTINEIEQINEEIVQIDDEIAQINKGHLLNVINDEIVLFAHKFVLFTACSYFTNLINFKGDSVCTINISIFNPHILYDIIASFYGVKQNSLNLSECEYLLEIIRCCNFLCLDNKDNLIKLCTLPIPEENFDLLLEIVNIVGYDDNLIKLIYDNLPAVDTSIASRLEFACSANSQPENYDLTKIDHDLVSKLLNYSETNIAYFCGENMVVKKCSSFNSILTGKIESVHQIPLTDKDTVYISDNYIFVSQDYKKFITCTIGHICIYDFETKKILHKILYKTTKIINMSLSYDSKKMIVCSTDSIVRIWDMENGKLIKEYKLKYGRSIREWAHANPSEISRIGNRIKEIFYKQMDLSGTIFSVSGSEFIISFHDMLLIVDYVTGKTLKEIRTQHIIINFFVSSNNKIISIGKDHSVEIWDFDGVLVNTLVNKSVFKIKFSCMLEMNKLILVGNDNIIQIWDVDTGKLVINLRGHQKSIINVCIASNNKQLISVDDSTIKLWDLSIGKLLGSIDTHDLVNKDHLREKYQCWNGIVKYFYIIPNTNKLI